MENNDKKPKKKVKLENKKKCLKKKNIKWK